MLWRSQFLQALVAGLAGDFYVKMVRGGAILCDCCLSKVIVVASAMWRVIAVVLCKMIRAEG